MRLPDTSNKAIILSNWSKTGVNTRKAPAFLQGLLQFDRRLVGDGGLEL